MPKAKGKKAKDLDPKARGKKVKGGRQSDDDRLAEGIGRARAGVRRGVKNVTKGIDRTVDKI